ncbi:DNA/RNA helicase domain-containing protein [Micromonospora sp. NPDC050397]|uniref:DNA/RNA helicase domain-containing protein n=1 Tax=Micromonospora sp. NPDC050397 TaxID=3364279 RepID=UPI00384A696B
MSAFRTSPEQVAELIKSRELVPAIEAVLLAGGHRSEQAEKTSWMNSLYVLAKLLRTAGLGDLDMLVEYQLPQTSRRVDVILAGAHPDTGRDSYLVIELKQWSGAAAVDDAEHLVEARGSKRLQLHPTTQVLGYCDYLADFLAVLWEWPEALRGTVFLHNLRGRQAEEFPRLAETEQSRLFAWDDRDQFIRFVKAHLRAAPGRGAAERLLDSAVRPSRQLLAHAADELADRSHFVLLGRQREAFEQVRLAVRQAQAGRRKKIVIVAGGPGSGKSVIALSLLAALAKEGRLVAHATGSRAFTRSMQRYAGRDPEVRRPRQAPLFNYFYDYMDAPRDNLDVLVCDEAHRIREWSKKGDVRGQVPQVEELFDAAKVPVFFLDDRQVVRPGEMGSVDTISRRARDVGYEVEVINLNGQHRCGGSAEFERWVDHLLGLADGDPYPWPGDERFHVGVVETPEALESLLARQQGDESTARMTAGFCWPWSKKPLPDGNLVRDVEIGDWKRPWNAFEDYPRGGIPTSAYWATDPAGFGQIGCIYTAQGFEYDWNGVIMGPDLVVRGGRFTSRLHASRDYALNGKDPLSGDDAGRLIRNTYKVLFTRGLKGVLLYSTDEQTRRFLADLVGPPRVMRSAVGKEHAGVHRIREGRPSTKVPDRKAQPGHFTSAEEPARHPRHN